jgi:hypothetical protein
LENIKTIDCYDLNQHHLFLIVMLSMLWSQIKINSIQLNWNTLGSSLFQQIVFFWFPLRVLALYLEWETNKRTKTSSSILNHFFFHICPIFQNSHYFISIINFELCVKVAKTWDSFSIELLFESYYGKKFIIIIT